MQYHAIVDRSPDGCAAHRLALGLKGLHNLKAGRLATVLLASAACISDRPAMAPDAVVGDAVTIIDFAFTPATLSAPSGTIVTWTNNDDVMHTVSSDDDQTFDSGAFGQDDTFQLTAGAPGTYTYICQIHPFMKATLIVTP